ncbi:MAG TPA: Gfo/Idh/MocA family oxidoreductase [Chloroflexota bacterium]
MASNAPLKVGVAGLGFGSTEFLPVLEKMPELKIVAGADLRPQALEAFRERYGGRTYESVEELCADPEVEAVWISTPNQLHGEHALAAAQHGKHMVIRKPMALTIEACQQILNEADKTGAKILAGGQTQGTNPLVQAVRQLVLSGELGKLRAINMWAYTGWMLSPREPQEVDESLGGGIVWRQAPHQLETVRWLGGGLVRSVRANTGRWRPERPNATGYFSAFMEFEGGTPVTIVYNAYGYFDTVDLVRWSEDRGHERRAAQRQALLKGETDEPKGKEAIRFGALIGDDPKPRIPWDRADHQMADRGPGPWLPGNQGVWIVSFDEGDVRASAQGIEICDNNGRREVPIPRVPGAGMAFLTSEPMELYDAVRHGKPMLHDGRWGMATAEVQWAIIESARQRKEIQLQHQVPVPDGY